MIRRLTSLLFGRRKAMVFSRRFDPSHKDQAPDGYTFIELTSGDFRNCALAGERGRRPRFEQRLSEGYRCAGFRDAEGRIVSYIWIARGDAGAIQRGDLGETSGLSARGRYVFKGLPHRPGARGSRVFIGRVSAWLVCLLLGKPDPCEPSSRQSPAMLPPAGASAGLGSCRPRN